MDHVAIMRKSWGLIPKILDGRKKIESRWGKNKCAPWEKVKVDDRIFFKNSGEPVMALAHVSKVLQFEDLNLGGIREILEKYGGDDGISVSDLENTIEWAKEKRYCTLVFLTNSKKVRPFSINKKGFGIGAAWLTITNITSIKL